MRDAVSVAIDGRPLRIELVEHRFPSVEGAMTGEGAIRLRFTAALPALDGGVHHLRYRNVHRADAGVYLANALVPASTRVSVTGQQRDVDQHELIIDYVLKESAATGAWGWWLLGVPVAIVAGRRIGRRQSRDRGGR